MRKQYNICHFLKCKENLSAISVDITPRVHKDTVYYKMQIMEYGISGQNFCVNYKKWLKMVGLHYTPTTLLANQKMVTNAEVAVMAC